MNIEKNEIWVPVKGYEGLYEVSNKARFKSIKTGKIFKGSTYANGRSCVSLTKDKKDKTYILPRLLLSSFVEKPFGIYHAAHLDGNYKNNNLDNLKWCTPKENNMHKLIHGTMFRPYGKNKYARNNGI